MSGYGKGHVANQNLKLIKKYLMTCKIGGILIPQALDSPEDRDPKLVSGGRCEGVRPHWLLNRQKNTSKWPVVLN